VIRASYLHPVAAGDAERAYAGSELAALLAAARGWFALAADLLAERAFPHAVDDERCKYCEFQAVCGPDAAAASLRKISTAPASSAVARFAALQGSNDGD
jgi:hypothetical protein